MADSRSGIHNPKLQIWLVGLFLTLAYLFLTGISGQINDIAWVDDTRIFLAEGRHGGVRVIDASDLSKPVEIGAFDTFGSANGIAVEGDTVYVADGKQGLLILSAADPKNLHEIGYVKLPGDAQDVAVSNGMVYLAVGKSGLVVVNAQNTAAPIITGHWAAKGGNTNALAVQGNVVYLTNGSGLQIIDVSSSQPALISEQSAEQAQAVAVASGLVFVGSGSIGLRIVNAFDPYTVNTLGDFPPSLAQQVTNQTAYPAYHGQSVAILGGFALLGTQANGLLVLNVTNPLMPIMLSAFPFKVPVTALAVKNGYIAAGLGHQGMQLLNLDAKGKLVSIGKVETVGDYSVIETVVAPLQGKNGISPKWWATVRHRVFDIGLLIVFLVFWVAFFAQFVLPLRTFKDRWQAFLHLWIYILGGHGPAIFIQNGKQVARSGESEKRGPGVLLLDTASAAQLRTSGRFTRAVGPGVVFTRRNEYIEEALPLYPMFQSLGPNTEKDIFTPAGEISEIAWETHGKTRNDIDVFAKIFVRFRLDSHPGEGHTQYGFCEDAVTKAVRGGRVDLSADPDEEESYRPWYELPVHLAVDIWREYLQLYTATGLFDPAAALSRNQPPDHSKEHWGMTGLEMISALMNERMKSPMLQEISHSGRPVFINKDSDSLQKKESREFKILQERGIKVLAVGVSQVYFRPEVERELLRRWQSSWARWVEQERDLVERERSYKEHFGKLDAARDYARCIMRQLQKYLYLPPSSRKPNLPEGVILGENKVQHLVGTKDLESQWKLFITKKWALESLLSGTRRTCSEISDVHVNLHDEEEEIAQIISWLKLVRFKKS